jgi:hypothetical protein
VREFISYNDTSRLRYTVLYNLVFTPLCNDDTVLFSMGVLTA